MGVPAVKEAFGLEDIREHDEWRVFATTAKSKRKHKKKSKEPNLLPRWFAYLAYAVAFCMFGMTIVVATLYGSTFLGITQYAWGIATITTLLVQFLLFEPLIIWARAFIEVRARLLQAMAPKPQEVEEEPTQDELEALPNKEDVTADQARDHDEDVAFNLPGSPEELVPDVLERHLPQLVDLFLLNFKGGVVGLEDFSELLTDFGVQADDPRLQEYWDSLPLNDNRESEWQPMLRACAKKELDKILLGIYLDLEHIEQRCKIAEFADLLKNMMAEPHIQMIIAEADGDDDGLVTFEQLRTAIENLIQEMQADVDVDRFLDDDPADAEESSNVESQVLRQLTAAKSRQQMSKSRSPPRSRAMTAQDTDVELLDA